MARSIHRVVISEPMALVPYECIVSYEGKPSPATAYDDPGLFENRGNAVSPWRRISPPRPVSSTRWRWGDEERRHYVLMHNAMAEAMAAAIARIARHYSDIVAWVAPGLTHRSFILGASERAANKVAGLAPGRRCAAAARRRQRSSAGRAPDRVSADAGSNARTRSRGCRAAWTSASPRQEASMPAAAPTRRRWLCRNCSMCWWRGSQAAQRARSLRRLAEHTHL